MSSENLANVDWKEGYDRGVSGGALQIIRTGFQLGECLSDDVWTVIYGGCIFPHLERPWARSGFGWSALQGRDWQSV